MSINKIAIFSLDQTLLNSPIANEDNKLHWEQIHGRKFPNNNWWSALESLCRDAFNITVNNNIKNDVIKNNIENNLTILVSGRIPIFKDLVLEILNNEGVPPFNHYFFNTKAQASKDLKIEVFNKLKKKFPEATEFEVWDNKLEDIPYLVLWGEENFGDKFKINIL